MVLIPATFFLSLLERMLMWCSGGSSSRCRAGLPDYKQCSSLLNLMYHFYIFVHFHKLRFFFTLKPGSSSLITITEKMLTLRNDIWQPWHEEGKKYNSQLNRLRTVKFK